MGRTSINISDEEKQLFTEAMKRDGMSQLTTWMKAVCSKYATGNLVPTAMAVSKDNLAQLLLKRMADNDGELPFGMTMHSTDMKDDPDGE